MDLWRVLAITVVVLGHWLVAAIWVKPDGEISLLSALEWVPYAAWATWFVQVMPVFFLVGGYANARALRSVIAGEQRRREWITLRTRRMWTPVTPLLLVWVGLIVLLRLMLDPALVSSASMSATIPLWFLAVYLTLTGAAPVTHRWWRAWGPASVAAMAGAAIAVDVARFVGEVPGIGWLNFVLVWATVHQIGYWWADRDAGPGISSATGWAVAAGALGVLVGITWSGLYPVAMLGVPGESVTNFAPPTSALLVLGVVQTGIIWGTAGRARSLVARPRAWRVVVSLSGVIMTIYLWHLSAMSLLAAGGINAFDGVVFSLEPGTTAWWLTRPLWIAALLVVLALLVAVFARYEWRIGATPPPRTRRWVAAGVTLAAGSAGAVAVWGLTARDGVIHWSIPLAAVIGAMILGAVPRRSGKGTARPRIGRGQT
ncbi:MAG TPA: acyltransferase [Acidimicrobiia bacterium]|nr:acyltransferase [Acidimicrobiia bacterium]